MAGLLDIRTFGAVRRAPPGRPARDQAPVPPATDQASTPAPARKSAAARLRLPLAQIT